MAQMTSLERKNNNQDLVSSDFNIRLKKIIHPLLLSLSKTKIKYKLVKCCNYSGKSIDYSKNRPIIFACNHTTSYDIPIAFNAIKEHTFLFAAKQPLEKMDELFFNLNGTIYVDRKDKEDMNLSKEAMIATLNKKRNILVFPEGTWNLTDSNLMHEMKWGIIDVAKQTSALIVPIALNYDYDKRVCMYRIGQSIDVNHESLKNGITLVRDSIASLRWDLMELDGIYKREEIDVNKERENRMNSVKEYPKLDYEYEKSVVFRTNATEEEVFEPIKKLIK